MSDGEPIATVETNTVAHLLPSAVFGLVAGAVLTLFVASSVASQLGIGLGVARLVTGVGGFVLAALLFLSIKTTGPVQFYRDRVTFGRRRIAYDDVSAAVRTDSWFGTAHFELLGHGAVNLELKHVSDPDEAERILRERLPSPAEQLEEGATGSGGDWRRDRMRERSTFWGYWDDEGELPAEPIVDAETLEDVMDVDVRSVDLDQIDDVDMTAADGLGDLDAGDLGTDAGGDGGGGFDGGGGGGGGGE